MLRQLGLDTGRDSIADSKQAEKLSAFLDKLDGQDKLNKTVLYSLNPADNKIFATMIGNFNDGSIKGKVQFGSGLMVLGPKGELSEDMELIGKTVADIAIIITRNTSVSKSIFLEQ